ncbi:unnamed protein product [Sphagnum jensenii]
MLDSKVSREFEQAQQEVHNLRQSTFGLDSYVEEVETLVTSAGSDVAPKYLGVWGMGGVGKSVLLKTLPPSSVPDELKELAQSMAQECAGLPLALKVIGGGMFGEKLPKQWELQLKKLTESRMHEGPVEELYERLNVGYDLLSDRLKQCFHYFAAFPENSNIVFEEILFHWSGEGLVPEHDGDDARA